MTNRHRGDVTVTLGGRRWVLRLTLGALAEIEAGLGATSLAALGERFGEGLRARDLIVIFGAVARGGGAPISDEEAAAAIPAAELPALAGAIATLLVEGFGEGSAPGPLQRPR